MANPVNPKSLLMSKWTHLQVINREKHFIVTKVTVDENQQVIDCIIEAVMTKNEYAIDWRQLKNHANWRPGWH